MATIYKRCPYCFNIVEDPTKEDSYSSEWSDDPILIDNGTKYDMVNKGSGEWRKEETDGRKHVGFTHPLRSHIKELQDNRKSNELWAIPEWEIENRTEFTELPEMEDDAFFLPTKAHIKELRESTEKIVTRYFVGDYLGSFAGYFNYMGRYWQGTRKLEWTDPNLDIYNGSIKNIHIEELRHSLGNSIPIAFLMERTVTETVPPASTEWDWYEYDKIGIYSVFPWDENLYYDEDDGYWYWQVNYWNRTYHHFRKRNTETWVSEWDILAHHRTLFENECILSLGTEEPETSPTLLYYKKADEENYTSFTDRTLGKQWWIVVKTKSDYYRSTTEPTHRFDGELYDSTGWVDTGNTVWYKGDDTWSLFSEDSYIDYDGYRWGIAHLP